MIFAPFVIIFILLVVYFLYKKYSVVFKRIGYQKSCQTLLPEWNKLLIEKFEVFSKLSEDHQKLFLDKMSILFSEKEWAKDLSDQDIILICARGIYPILYRETNYYPAISYIQSDENGFLWYRELKKQFEVEYGVIIDKAFNDAFVHACHDFLYSDKALKSLTKDQFLNLEHFFKTR